jgi:hypothetical protein
VREVTLQVSPRREGVTQSGAEQCSLPGSPGVNMAAAEGGVAAPSSGRSGAGPPSAETTRRRRTLGPRMEVLWFGPRRGGSEGRVQSTPLQLWSTGVLGRRRLSN